jgi:hypothetical protein
MKKLLTKAKSTFDTSTSHHSSPNPPPESCAHRHSTIQPPSLSDLYRYRYTHGVNLGSVFVLEKWLTPSMFTSPTASSGGSELDAVLSSVSSTGLQATKTKWESHWRNAVTEQDFEWLVKVARCNGLRVPIGFFTLGPEWCVNTEFEGVRSVYEGSWREVKGLIERAREWGVGVLIDFHAVYGGANEDAHSGTSKGRAELWGNKGNLERSRKALVCVARELRGCENLIGIQVVNEAKWGARGLWEWYERVIEEIGDVDEEIPLYISDGWELGKALDWAGKRKGKGNPVVIDTHRYYTFSERDRSQSPHEIIARIESEMGELDGKMGGVVGRGCAQLVVGEWSCVLDGRTWSRVKLEDREGLVRDFGLAQSKKWQQRAGGSYFWTYKMDWMDGGEWGFVKQTKKGNIVPPSFLALPVDEVRSRAQAAQVKRDDLAGSAKQSHEEYWNRTCPGKKFEHQLYNEGWDVGFSDALTFFGMRADGALRERVAGEGCDKIGCLELWVKKRFMESGKRGEFVWEWEQGLRSGVAAFYQCVSV